MRRALIEALECWAPSLPAVEAYAEKLEFAGCLPKKLLGSCVSARLFDTDGASSAIVAQPVTCRRG